MKFIGILCTASNGAIGYRNRLLYRIPKDMEYFKQKTVTTIDKNKMNAVIMGKNTFLSIPNKFRPLKNRINLIISDKNYDVINNIIKENKYKNCYLFNNIEQSMGYIYNNHHIENVYVSGGQSIYRYFYQKGYFNEIFENKILAPICKKGDRFFTQANIGSDYVTYMGNKIEDHDSYDYDNTKISATFQKFWHINRRFNKRVYDSHTTDEKHYLELLKNILKTGEERETRNGKTISKFGVNMQFDLEKGFPLITTKKMYWKGIVEELIWFINSGTNSKDLEKKDVNIWKKNSSLEVLNDLKLPYKEGWCGPIYGFQWRHFNAKYLGPNTDYSNKGIDQLQTCINLIKNNPTSRRIIMTAWNPCQLDEMVLPPCHISYQFYVRNNKLDCLMYQRSGDMFLGIPFNIASTSLLVTIMAKMTNLEPGRVNISIGDAHIYTNHIKQIEEQLGRRPYQFPKLIVKKTHEDIGHYSHDDIELQSYYKHAGIKADMVA